MKIAKVDLFMIIMMGVLFVATLLLLLNIF